MWDKYFRQVVFTAIYQVGFYADELLDFKPDIDYIMESTDIKDKSTVVIEDFDYAINLFKINQDSYTKQLKSYLPSWDKTFPLVKSCLFTFLVEQSMVSDKSPETDIKTIIGKYLRLSEELIGGQNVALVHAVISKIVKAEKE